MLNSLKLISIIFLLLIIESTRQNVNASQSKEPTTKAVACIRNFTPIGHIPIKPVASPSAVLKAIKPTIIVLTSTITVSPTITPQPTTPASDANMSSADIIFSLVNEHRKQIGLPPFEKDDKLCQLAQSRDPELQNEVNTGTIHKGIKDRNLGYWLTENMAYYGNPDQDMNFWLSDEIHKKAIEGASKYSCTYCHGNICVEEFTSYTPK